MRVPAEWAAFCIVFGLAITGLIDETSGSKFSAIGYVSLIAGSVLLFPHFALKANGRNVLLWLLPIWELFTACWSNDPAATVHASMLILVTMVGVGFVGALPHRRAVNTGFFLALFGYVIYSVLYGGMWRFDADEPFTGIITGKNEFGHVAAMEILFSLGMISWAGSREGRLIVMAGLAGVLAGFGALLASHATGALLSTLVASSIFVAVLIFRRMTLPFRVALIAAMVGVVIIYLAFGDTIEQEVFASILKKFGKDTTLTGRTVLWGYADRLIAEHPIIGQGFSAFWTVDNPEAVMIWRTFGILPNHGFSFHNTFRDILVDSGAIGLALYVGSILFHFVSAGLHALRSGEVIDANRVAILFYFLMRTPVETISYGGLTMDTLVLIGFLCFPVTAATRWRRPAVEQRTQWRTAPAPLLRERVAARTLAPVRHFRGG